MLTRIEVVAIFIMILVALIATGLVIPCLISTNQLPLPIILTLLVIIAGIAVFLIKYFFDRIGDRFE